MNENVLNVLDELLGLDGEDAITSCTLSIGSCSTEADWFREKYLYSFVDIDSVDVAGALDGFGSSHYRADAEFMHLGETEMAKSRHQTAAENTGDFGENSTMTATEEETVTITTARESHHADEQKMEFPDFLSSPMSEWSTLSSDRYEDMLEESNLTKGTGGTEEEAKSEADPKPVTNLVNLNVNDFLVPDFKRRHLEDRTLLVDFVFEQIVSAAVNHQSIEAITNAHIEQLKWRLKENPQLYNEHPFMFHDLLPLFVLTREEFTTRMEITRHRMAGIIQGTGIKRWPCRRYRQIFNKVVALTERYRTKIRQHFGKVGSRPCKLRNDLTTRYQKALNRVRTEALLLVEEV